MDDQIDTSATTADFEESDANDHELPEGLEDRDEDVPEKPDEVDHPDPGLKF